MELITDDDIREYLGHNGSERSIRFNAAGYISEYGSRVDTDRSLDYWRPVRLWGRGSRQLTREDLIKQILEWREHCRQVAAWGSNSSK